MLLVQEELEVLENCSCVNVVLEEDDDELLVLLGVVEALVLVVQALLVVLEHVLEGVVHDGELQENVVVQLEDVVLDVVLLVDVVVQLEMSLRSS